MNTTNSLQTNVAVLSKGMFPRIFPSHLKLIPQLSEVYELALAFYESQILNNEEIIENSAYFSQVNQQYTNHFLMTTGQSLKLPKHSSSRLKSFFVNNQFRTGYATHGLFPYRGKFHPQMIKALINIMGLKSGSIVLDPMMGSGTVPIEACLMGIKSIGIDASPFCHFMAQTKLDALVLPLREIKKALADYKRIFNYFVKVYGHPIVKGNLNETIFPSVVTDLSSKTGKNSNRGVFNFILLAYFDAAGYSTRSKRVAPLVQFHKILERYIFVVEKIQYFLENQKINIGETNLITGNACALTLDDCSVDGILFSPPYSFAIDYLENDDFHLNALGVDIENLRKQMIGLKGKSLREKYNCYIQDMNQVLSECSRVLKPMSFCSIIIGTNDNQLGKALGIPITEVLGLNQIIIDLAKTHGLILVRQLKRRISGIANTMRDEFIIILQK
ncbi:hypothetical protein KKA14_17985 [bacterium]|nr:hypothetical protein [bacterium]